MNIEYYEDLILHDYEPSTDTFKDEVLWGLKQNPKSIPSKFFYDERGSRLFREITTLPEYYLTRTEITIMRGTLPEMARLIGPSAQIIEFGTGAGMKTKLLLKALDHPAAYLPIDISREQLLDASLGLVEEFPDLEVWPICADYTDRFQLPIPEAETQQTVVYFPGSTIGNFIPHDAAQFLKNVADMIGPRGTLLIGVDRIKDEKILNAAYNDSRGVTAEFNLNLVHHINREFHTQLSPRSFQHYAFFNQAAGRIEMHLVSQREQEIYLDDEMIHLDQGEHITTEYSYKYSSPDFQDLLSKAGYEVIKEWSDTDEYFSIFYAKVRT